MVRSLSQKAKLLLRLRLNCFLRLSNRSSARQLEPKRYIALPWHLD
ncbi:MAG: hypothetical protein OJF52_000750 [Nitrospira sp.]|jgi:hypothetical protein|nr:hypothetical protein [Nitrospira sp.]WHZ13916.1 MAG: hypothetical protein OJF52_000750 [Nitrospira sp.]